MISKNGETALYDSLNLFQSLELAQLSHSPKQETIFLVFPLV